MPPQGKTKTKILTLLKILYEETDANHGLTMSQILEHLSEYGVSAERKSIYADIAALRESEIGIQTLPRNPVEYAFVQRGFSLGELMLLVDTVQSCRTITEKQSAMLITNIKTLASNNEQEKLNRRIHVVGRIKSNSDSVFGNVDVIHESMRQRKKIAFTYYRLGTDGKRSSALSKKHIVTPVGITYEDGFYYMSAWDDAHNNISEYRIDRMGKVRVLENEPAARNSEITNYRPKEQNAAVFGHFYGEEVVATLAVQAGRIEIITDRFGDLATFLKSDEQTAHVRVRVCKSEQFFGWIAGLGKVVEIVAPQSLLDEYRNYLKFLLGAKTKA